MPFLSSETEPMPDSLHPCFFLMYSILKSILCYIDCESHLASSAWFMPVPVPATGSSESYCDLRVVCLIGVCSTDDFGVTGPIPCMTAPARWDALRCERAMDHFRLIVW
jgi:hypothetical protein